MLGNPTSSPSCERSTPASVFGRAVGRLDFTPSQCWNDTEPRHAAFQQVMSLALKSTYRHKGTTPTNSRRLTNSIVSKLTTLLVAVSAGKCKPSRINSTTYLVLIVRYFTYRTLGILQNMYDIYHIYGMPGTRMYNTRHSPRIKQTRRQSPCTRGCVFFHSSIGRHGLHAP